MQNDKIAVTVDGKTQYCEYNQTIASVVEIELLCGGHGNCGKCKVIAKGVLSPLTEKEKASLSEDEIACGTRLACTTRILGECEISTDISPKGKQKINTDASLPDITVDPDFEKLGMALDIGTTTLAARLYDKSGTLLSDSATLNPESRFGADVISRIEAAMAGHAEELQALIKDAIRSLACDLCQKASRTVNEIETIVATGNTAMLYLLTKTPPTTLSRAPFLADRLFGEEIKAKALGILDFAENAKFYLPPCISAFVGADTVAALLASEFCQGDDGKLLVDIGTNGEIALWDKGRLTVCSTAAGPAFEGVGISAGMRGEVGAIDKVYSEKNALKFHTIGNAPPRGICGSGIIDAAATFMELELMDETGYLEDGDVTICNGITVTQADIRALQLVKSAIYAGIGTLVKKRGISFDTLSCLYVAGSFGSYLNMINAVGIGLLPSKMLSKIKVIGNAALAGASMLLLDKSLRQRAKALAQNAETIELSTDQTFSELYFNSMLFDDTLFSI